MTTTRMIRKEKVPDNEFDDSVAYLVACPFCGNQEAVSPLLMGIEDTGKWSDFEEPFLWQCVRCEKESVITRSVIGCFEIMKPEDKPGTPPPSEYIIPCVHEETYKLFVEEMRKEDAETFDEFLQTVLKAYGEVKALESDDHDPELTIGTLLMNPDVLATSPGVREHLEALKAMYPEAYEKNRREIAARQKARQAQKQPAGVGPKSPSRGDE